MTEKCNKKRGFIIPCLVLSLLLFGSFTADSLDQDSNSLYQDNQQPASKKDIMLGVLESLENGVPYEKNHSWGNYAFDEREFPVISLPELEDFNFDFNFKFPEFRFDEKELQEFEARMEEFSRKLEKKMEEMARHLDSVMNSRF